MNIFIHVYDKYNDIYKYKYILYYIDIYILEYFIRYNF